MVFWCTIGLIVVELGYEITEEDLLSLIDELNQQNATAKEPTDDGLSTSRVESDSFSTDRIEFYAFVELLHRYSTAKDDAANEEDILEAFVALGGSRNKTGTIPLSELRSFCERFDLSFDVQKIASENNIPIDGHKLEYQQFKSVMSVQTRHL